MSYTLQHFALIFVVLMVCLSFTFAPLFGPPVDPPPGKGCVILWIFILNIFVLLIFLIEQNIR